LSGFWPLTSSGSVPHGLKSDTLKLKNNHAAPARGSQRLSARAPHKN
jgi:hypothetical protein